MNKRSIRWAVLASLLAALAMVVAACGGDNNGGGGGGSKSIATQGKLAAGKQGGALTVLAAADVDYMDPGQTYYTWGYAVLYPTNRTLYGFKPNDSINVQPDLATGKPEISSDQKQITVHIRKGVKYAPPVNREVKAQDIKYAMERAFTKEVPSGYAGTYFGTIVGAPTPSNTTSYQPISGIQTPDDNTLVIKLKDASATVVSAALVMPITTPVPKEYAQKFDQKNPTTYDDYVAFTGPYMVKNNASGKLVGRKPGKEIDMVRNPNWDKSTDPLRPAYLDSITIQEGNDDLATASKRALNGESTVCCDSGAPPAQVLKQALQRTPDQVKAVPSGGTRYIAFNTTIKPFDNINVRKALIAASDRTALRLTRGGAVLGDVATGWLPPGIPGFDQAGGLKQNTDLDFLKYPQGNADLAKKYMLAAKEQDSSLPIDSNGKWTGGQKILTVATNADPGKKTAEVYQNQIEQMGFKLNFRIVPQDTLYTKFCSVPSAKVAVCPNVGWFKDFVDPQSMLDATFNGNNILKQGNVNWPQLDDKTINDAMQKASTIPSGTSRDEAWAKIGHQIAEQAPGIPWIWDKSATFGSKNVQLVVNQYSTAPDFNYTSLK